MNRIQQLFEKKKDHIITVYCTAGFPSLGDTLTVVEELEKAGADIVEIGMPFSDPLADGPVIQKSSEQALRNGMSMQVLFDQLKDLRKKVTIPVVVMGYLNPVYHYGIENFARSCSETGIDGMILPDLPAEEYQKQFRSLFDQYGLTNIFLITPQTDEERIRRIDEVTNGFIYMVSSSATTGGQSDISQKQKDYFERIQKMNLRSPRMIGFGISNKENFTEACQFANGVIIGSAFIRELQKGGKISDIVKNFMNRFK